MDGNGTKGRRRRATHWTALGLAAALLVGLWGALIAAPATTDELGGKDRFLAHLATDKPIYRAGEKVRVRGTVLHAETHRPLGLQTQARVEIRDPKGSVVAGGDIVSIDSVLGFEWAVPAGQAGGEYTVKVSFPWMGYAPTERTFDIRAYRAPRLKNQIVFVRDGYGPGDEVTASCHTERAEGGVPAGAAVTVTARVDGAEVYRGAATVSATGDIGARFTLPKRIARGEGTLAFAIQDGGVVETATKTIPILLQTVDLKMYPEGGYLVAGLPNRVYLEARTPAQKPADIAGAVVDDRGREVTSFRTAHEGRGRFLFTPKKGRTYTLKIAEPAGIETTYPLPSVKRDGVILRALQDATAPGRAVRLAVGAPKGGRYLVTLQKREREVARLDVNLPAGRMQRLAVLPEGDVDGVLVASVWKPDGTPLAERLVFRHPERALKLSVTPSAERSVPGAPVELTVKATDANGEPVEAVVGLTVTDDSVQEMIEKREQAPRLPAMVLLEDEVGELRDAHVYLDPANEKAPLATDLLLGTQGWRRFALMDTASFLREHGDDGRRALAMQIVTRREVRTRSVTALEAVVDLDDGAVAGGAVPRGAVAVRMKMVKKRSGKGRRAPGRAAGPPPAAQPVVVADAIAPAAAPAAEKPVDRAPRMRSAKKRDIRQDPARRELAKALDEAAGMEEAERSIVGIPVAAGASGVVLVREYAHRVRPDRKPGQRTDFTETLFWTAGVKTDATTGEARVKFAMADAVTAYRVMADGFDGAGALGAATVKIESVEPFYVEPKLPLEVTAGDRIALPLAVVSGVSEALTGVTLTASADDGLRVGSVEPFSLPAEGRVRRVVDVRVGQRDGEASVTVAAAGGPYRDNVKRTVRIVPRGFPAEQGFGGMLTGGTPAFHEIVIPGSVVANSVKTNIAVYPTPLANMTKALERLIREPYGCFEQTSSTTYPLVMAQQYFTSHTGVPADVIERSNATLAKGYKRLTSFECKQRGYEWFGQDPGHEALTAYGLMEFTDMAEVRTVDRAMLDRTRAWLLKTRDGEGGFTRARRALHTWIQDRDCSNGYILWALLESGTAPGELQKELDAYAEAAAKSDNSYVLALGANVLHLAGKKDAAAKLMAKLAERQETSGQVSGGTTTIVGSGGKALEVETSSLAVLAWLRDPKFAMNTERGIKYLAETCEGGRYGSTQSTVLALRAIVEYDKARSKPKAKGAVRVWVDGQPVGDPVDFDENTHGAIELPDVGELLGPGKHRLELRMEGGSAMPYAVGVDYYDETPDSATDCKVGLSVELLNPKLQEGDVTEVAVSVQNRSGEAVPTPVALIGLPGGLEPRHDQLKELVKQKKIAAYEVRGREVVLYWRSLAANESRDLAISAVAAVPGTYTGPASRAYLYYTDELKTWVSPVKAEISAK